MKRKIIALQLAILMILINVGINFANDYTGITQVGGTDWEKSDGTQEWVVTEYEDGQHVGATGTKVTAYVGDDYENSKSIYLNQGESVGDTVYKGYDWSSCTGKDAPPAGSFDTDSDQMKTLVNEVGFDSDTMSKVTNGETVTIISEPTIRIKNTQTGEVIEGTVTEILDACAAAEADGVKNGEGIRYVENYAKSILTKLKEEQPEMYEAILKNKDGQGQAVHQEQLYDKPTPSTTPGPSGTPSRTPSTSPSATPSVTPSTTPSPSATPTPTSTPTPTPTPTPDPSKPYVTITEGLAPTGSSPTANGKIYNDEFGVPSNPIPVTEDLSVVACTDALGAVENLGLYTVNYEPFEYTYTLYWEQYGDYTYTWEETVYDSYGNAETVTKSETRTGVINWGTYSDKIELSGSAPFIKIRDDTDYYIAKNVTITSVPLPSHSFDIDANLSFREVVFQGADEDRVSNSGTEKIVTHTFYKDEDETVSDSEIEKAWGSETSGASVFDFWTRPIQDTLSANGTAITSNGALTGTYKCFTPAIKQIPSDVLNRSLDSGYPSSGIHDFVSVRPGKGGSMSAFGFEVNPVRIHTPIYNEMIITSPSTNQLENLSTVTSGYKIVTLGDEFTVTVNISGPSIYYYYPDGTTKQMTLDTSKYVKDVIIECGVCGKTYHSRSHTCPWYNTLLKNDNTEYPIVTTVVAINNGTNGVEVANRNTPDDIYVLKQYGGVHLVGKIYDLQVRTTDDVGWKLRKAEDLAKLPTGEAGDNLITSYKYGIKLGYRAYFDLKTLGTATEDLYLTPKIYYSDKEGNLVDVDLYYKTSSKEYKKLEDDDIVINMIMNKTNGTVNNQDFNIERAAMLTINPDIDYTKEIGIGGLNGMLLTASNSVATKYNGVYIWNPTVEQSRRWYGEIYLPASTIVAEKGTSLKDVMNGKHILKDGYLIVTFENIVTRFDDGSTYLQYSMGRDTDGVVFSPDSSGNLVDPSIMCNEKTDDGKQALKDSINLPNGKTFTEYLQTDAPIIIYDVSLRANDDYEASGTH